MNPWLQTHTGRVFEFPVRPDMFHAVDIAHSLAHLCRYGGHCNRFYSVAEHSVLMARHFLGRGQRDLAQAALLHDAAEAYICDLPRPIKALIPQYATVAQEVESAIERWSGLHLSCGIYPYAVKDVDFRICLDERDQNMGSPPKDWEIPGEPVGVTLQLWTPPIAKAMFLAAFARLFPELPQ